MFSSRLVTFILLAPRVIGYSFELGDLIKRIYIENDSVSTVFFVGKFYDGFVGEFLAVNSFIPAAILTAPSTGCKNTRFYSNAILVVQTFNTFDILQEFILDFRVRKNVIVFSDNMANLMIHFHYFHTNNFTRIFGVIETDQYAFLPYSRNSLQKISKTNPLPNALANLNGFVFRTGVQFEIPRIFWYSDRNNQIKIAGYAGSLFLSFLKKHNATIDAVYNRNFKHQFDFDAIIKKKMHFRIVGWNGGNEVQLSYPLIRVGTTMLVPLNGYLNTNQYFLRPFSIMTWAYIGLSLVYIVVMDVLKDIWRQQPGNVWKSISRTILTLLNMPLEKRLTRAYRFHFLVNIFAFIMVNIYLVSLTSFLTVFIKINQYDTIKELVDNNVPLMVSDFGWKFAVENLKTFGIEKILKTVDDATVLKARTTYANANFSYIVDVDTAHFFLKLHERYASHKFHMIREYFQEHYVGYILAKDSPFLEILNTCIVQSMAGGLLGKWTDDAASVAVKGITRCDNEVCSDNKIPLTLDHLRFAWIVLGAGLSMGFVVFLFENYRSNVRLMF